MLARPAIEELYIRRGLHLPQVHEEMVRMHGFVARFVMLVNPLE
jgi:hypothetical protein